MKKQIGVATVGLIGMALSMGRLSQGSNAFGEVVLKDCDKPKDFIEDVVCPVPNRLSHEELKREFSISLFNYNDATMLLAKRQLFEVDGYMVAGLNLKVAVKALNGLKRRFGQ